MSKLHAQDYDEAHANVPSKLPPQVPDWRMMLGQLACYEPCFIMLFGLTVGDIEIFVTYQNYYGSKIFVWFWNVREIIGALRNLDYNLIYKSLLESSY